MGDGKLLLSTLMLRVVRGATYPKIVKIESKGFFGIVGCAKLASLYPPFVSRISPWKPLFLTAARP